MHTGNRAKQTRCWSERAFVFVKVFEIGTSQQYRMNTSMQTKLSKTVFPQRVCRKSLKIIILKDH